MKLVALLDFALPLTMHAFFVGALPLAAASSAYTALRSSGSAIQAIRRSAGILASLAVAVALASTTAAPLAALLSPAGRAAFEATLPLQRSQLFPQTLALAQRLHVSHSYGLFRAMTGRGVGGEVARPELVILGRRGEGNWSELPFRWKPNLERGSSPAWVAPHQPRLDWQMWFAALAPDVNHSGAPWILTLCAKLLAGSKDVFRLLAPGPFSADAPPEEVQIMRYTSEFTSNWHKREWWSFHLQPTSWLVPVRLEHIPLQYRGSSGAAAGGWLCSGEVQPVLCAALAGLALGLLASWRPTRLAKRKLKED
jgi:hypothetical protein